MQKYAKINQFKSKFIYTGLWKNKRILTLEFFYILPSVEIWHCTLKIWPIFPKFFFSHTILISFYRTNLISVKKYFLKKNNFNEPKSYPTFFPWALLASRLCFSREALGTSESHAMQNGALSSVYFAQLAKIPQKSAIFQIFLKYFSNGTTQEWRTKFPKYIDFEAYIATDDI